MARKVRAKARGKDARTRRIERRLRAQLRQAWPDLDIDDLMDAIRPSILAAARDGRADAESIPARLEAEALIKELAGEIAEAVARQEGGSPE